MHVVHMHIPWKGHGFTMIVGASTASLYPLETERALYELASRGVQTLELFINCTDELSGAPMQRIRELIRTYGLRIQAFHPFTSPCEPIMLFSTYERRVDEMLRYYCRYFEVMHELEVPIFVLHGASYGGNCPAQRYVERYHLLYRTAKRYGVTVAQENVHYCMCKDLNLLDKMVQDLGDEVAFTLDIKQALRSGHDPFLVLNTMRNKALHIHVSDNDETHDCMLPGKGTFPLKTFIERLQALSFQGALIVELYRNNYSEYDDIAQSIRDVEKIVRGIS